MTNQTPLTRGSGGLDRGGASFSIPSIIAVVSAITSFFVGSGLGFVLAIAAIIFGAIGALLALSPARRGGIVSIFSIGAGVLAVIASILRLIF